MSNNTLSTWPWADESFINTVTDGNPLEKRRSRDRYILERFLMHKHMQETIERFEWSGLPNELNHDLIERIIYFRYKGALFRSDLGRYMFLPFTLRGENTKTIDSYGRYVEIVPVLFTGQWKLAGDGSSQEDIAYMSDRSYEVVYDMPENREESDDPEIATQTQEEYSKDKAVILTDTSLEISQDFSPMQYFSKVINEQLADILVLVNMDLISSAKVFYLVAKDEAQKQAIEKELYDLDDHIMNEGKRYVIVTSLMDVQELNGLNQHSKDTSRYFQSYQSIDNIRKSMIGCATGGTFLKQEHTTEMETENSTDGDSVLKNALRMREQFCEIANAVFDLNISVKLKENQSSNIVEPKGSQTLDRESGDE